MNPPFVLGSEGFLSLRSGCQSVWRKVSRQWQDRLNEKDRSAIAPAIKRLSARNDRDSTPTIADVEKPSASANCQSSSLDSRVSPPLRVVRFVEAGHVGSQFGRMVISGRMADVCAELDRLVAREAQDSCSSRGAKPSAC